ncbi:enolase C-terminal domain-like protein [Tirmania nivea]|nr:enolase C-terminal domain-like protein [Tirmania nivea]
MALRKTPKAYRSKDVRFPTSLDKTGSDAMNDAGDYSSAYCILKTDVAGLEGHGMTFTIGRGNDIVCHAIDTLAPRIVNQSLSDLTTNMGQTWRHLVSDSQYRWIGPEKGVIHLALGAIVNALWDLWSKFEKKPLWMLIVDFTPEEFVRCIDFRYITDTIAPEEAVALLKEQEGTKAQRVEDALRDRAAPAYTTSAGWLGYGEDKMERLLRGTREAVYRHFKSKVGGSVEEDRKRLTIVRRVLGYDQGNVVMVDANQVWSVPEAIEYMKQLAVRETLKPYYVGVATGEICQNRVMFKQLLMSGAIDVCQIDACRLGGVNEVLAVLIMAKNTIDYVCVSGKLSLLEFVDYLHEHFIYPSVIKDGFYVTPREPGHSVEMKRESME